MSVLDISTRKELVHAVIPLFHRGSGGPYSEDWMDGMFAKYAPELWAQVPTWTNPYVGPMPAKYRPSHTWDDFLKNCFFDITIFKNNSTHMTRQRKGLRFNSLMHLYDTALGMCDTSAGFSTSDCHVKIYSVVDNAVDTIGHMGGYNKFFEIMIDGTPKGQTVKDVWEAFPGFMTRLPFPLETLQRIYQVALNIVPVYNSDQEYAAGIWVPVKRKRGLYRLPATTCNEFQLGSGRRAYNRDTEVWAGAGGGPPNNRFVINSIGIIGMPLDHKITNIGELLTSDYAMGGWNPRGAWMFANYSVLLCYGLQCIDDPNWVSVYIKPYLGMDTFTFPKFDPNSVRLEIAVTTQEHRERFYALDMSSDMPNEGSAPLPADPNDAGTHFQPVRLRRSTILERLGRKIDPQSNNLPMYRMGQIRFYFRKLGTPFVSPVSPFYLQIGSANRDTMSIWDMTIQKER